MGDFDVVFLVGCPRSGTSFLQQMLANHPQIASPNETHLFSRYVSPLAHLWDSHSPTAINGVPAIVEQSEFDGGVRALIDSVYRPILARKPGARILLDKTPGHALHLGTIHRFLPDARVIHIVRDGRDVVASLLRAAQSGWGEGWAPTRATNAARQWVDHVRAARSARNLPVLEVRYEQLIAPEGAEALLRALEFCGADVSREQADALHARFDLQKGGRKAMLAREGLLALRPRVRDERSLGRGGSGDWTGLAWYQRQQIERTAGALLAELGYTRPGWTGVNAVLGAAVALWDAFWPRWKHRTGHLRQAVTIRTSR